MSIQFRSLIVLIGLLPTYLNGAEQGLVSYTISGQCGIDKRDVLIEGEFPYTYHDIVVRNPNVQLDSFLAPCKSKLIDVYIESAIKEANNRTGLSQREKEWWMIYGPVSLKAEKCSIFSHKGSSDRLLLLRTTLNADRSKNITGNELLSIFLVDISGTPSRFVSQHLTNKSIFDIRRNVSIEHICNFDEDRQAEIIMKDQRYAGYGYMVCNFGDVDTPFSCIRHKTRTPK
ncbi:MAG: hypothetical protein OEU50_20930 [Gammaproteobacteria bacterium]|nr:hypothetical protein [Gammaproteobacteria bacterium]